MRMAAYRPKPVKIVDTMKAVKIEIFAPITHPIHDAMNVRAVLRIPFTVGSLGIGSVRVVAFSPYPPLYRASKDPVAGACVDRLTKDEASSQEMA